VRHKGRQGAKLKLMHTYVVNTYKVVQIWPGQTVTCLHTISPGHIWTTLYMFNFISSDHENATLLHRFICFVLHLPSFLTPGIVRQSDRV
jgi:hypothetical protein